MRRRSLELALDRTGRLPLPTQIAQALAADVKRGRLAPGDRLPGTRALAATLGVHRNTVLAAYEELASEGWVRSTNGLGTFVERDLPLAISRGRSAGRSAAGFPIPSSDVEADTFDRGAATIFDWGVPDMRLFPKAALARAFRRALAKPGTNLLQYTWRSSPLHEPIARMLSDSRGFAFGDASKELLVTRGSQMALYLVARALVRPGDVVAVEDPGYEAAWQAFRAAGAELAGVPVDEHGVSVEAIGRLAERRPLRAVFVTPHRQCPTTATLSASRRIELLRLAAAKRFAIVEDDWDYEFHYDGGAVLPLASDDRAGVVVYVGSLSKILAPGLRVGYLVGPAALVEKAALLRRAIDLQGDRAVESAIAEMMEDGEVERHVRRSRRIYRARRDALAERLRDGLGDVLAFDVPSGGLAIWARVRDEIDVEAWASNARAAGLAFRTGSSFSLTGERIQAIRLGFGFLTEREAAALIARIVAALPRKGVKRAAGSRDARARA